MTHNAAAVVSVVIATRNRPVELRRALESVYAQTLQDFEVLVTDDGSDQSALVRYEDTIRRFDDRLHFHAPLAAGESGSGPAATRNRGLARARGRFIAFLDDDDWWTWPEHLGAAVDALSRTGQDLYFADMHGYRGDTLVWDTWRLDKDALLTGEPVPQSNSGAVLIERGALMRSAARRIVHLNTLVLTRSLVEKAGPLLPRLRWAEDHEFVLRLADFVDRAVFNPTIVARHRLPEGDSSTLAQSAIEQHLQAIAAVQHLRARARTGDLRRTARQIESWHLRLLSLLLVRDGCRETAMAFAWQAFAMRPSPGSAFHVVRLLARLEARQ